MAKTIADDPVALVMQCEINCENPPVPATYETLRILNTQIGLIDLKRGKLKQAYDRLKQRIEAHGEEIA